jgi:hypothetical protein
MVNSLDQHALVSLGVRIIRNIEEDQQIEREEKALSERKKAAESTRSDLAAAFRLYGIDIMDDVQWRAFIDEHIEDIMAGANLGPNASGETAPPPRISSSSRPNISVLLLSKLEDLGAIGAKAAELNAWLKAAHGIDPHWKTVGMSLYRLSQEMPPKVHRIGHKWFFGPAPAGTENPGVDAPGETSLLDDEKGGTDA